MATVAHALAKGVLVLHGLPDWERREAARPLYVAHEFYRWIDETDRLHDVRRTEGGRTAYEHAEQLLSDLRCSDRPAAGGIRRMMPTPKGVWSIHAPMIRLYGWACAPRTFVLISGALESETKKDRRLNDAKRDEVTLFIRRHKLEDTIVRGDIRAIFP